MIRKICLNVSIITYHYTIFLTVHDSIVKLCPMSTTIKAYYFKYRITNIFIWFYVYINLREVNENL